MRVSRLLSNSKTDDEALNIQDMETSPTRFEGRGRGDRTHLPLSGGSFLSCHLSHLPHRNEPPGPKGSKDIGAVLETVIISLPVLRLRVPSDMELWFQNSNINLQDQIDVHILFNNNKGQTFSRCPAVIRNRAEVWGRQVDIDSAFQTAYL